MKKFLNIVLVLIVFFLILIPKALPIEPEDEYFYMPDERNLMDLGQYEKAENLFQNKLKQASQAKDKRSIIKYRKNLADILLRKADYLTAEPLYIELVNEFDSFEDKKLKRSILHALGNIYNAQGEFKLAIEYYQKALNMSEELNYQYGIIAGNTNIANILLNKGDYSAAQEKYLQAFKVANEMNNESYVLSVEQSLASLYNYQGNYSKAIDTYNKIIEKASKYQDKTLYADSIHNLGLVYFQLGQYDQSKKFIEEALKIYQSLNDKKKMAKACMNIASANYEAYFNENKPENKGEVLANSINYYSKAFDISREINAEDTALLAFRQLMSITTASIVACSELLAVEKDFKEDLSEISGVISPQDNQEMNSAMTELFQSFNICKTLDIEKERENQIVLYKDIISFFEEKGYNIHLPQLYISLADVYFTLEDIDNTFFNLNKAIELYKKIDHPDLWEAYKKLGDTYYEYGNKYSTDFYDKALNEYEKAIEEVNKFSNNITNAKDKQSYIDSKQDLFIKAARLKVQKGDHYGARFLIEYARLSEQNDIFFDLILKSDAKKANETIKAVKQVVEKKENAAKLQKELSESITASNSAQNEQLLRAKLQQARKEFQKTALDLQASNPEVLQFVAIKPSNLRTIQQKLPDDSVLIEPIILPDRIITFVAPPGKQAPFYKETMVDTQKLLPLIVNFRKAILAMSTERADQTSKELYELLIKPVEDDIKSYKTIVISPYGNLRYLPFQALFDGEHYLVEKYAVVNATSSTGLKIGDQKYLKGSSLLAFGNPTLDLPAAENEVKLISGKFSDSKVFLGNTALRQIFDDEVYNDYEVIHLATHGLLNSSNPDNSKLLFAEGTYLTVQDIMAYDFSDKNMVVLSACDSNIGKAQGAEVSALGTAFELAAAPTVIASLWKVNDESTSVMMQELYNQLVQGNSKAASLREAQLKLIRNEKYNNPYFWAPFVMLGEWK